MTFTMDTLMNNKSPERTLGEIPGQEVWQMFVSSQQRRSRHMEDSLEQEDEHHQGMEFVEFMLESLSGTAGAPRAKSEQLARFTRALDLIAESVRDGTLTEREGGALLRHLAVNLVENEMEVVLERVFQFAASDSYSYSEFTRRTA